MITRYRPRTAVERWHFQDRLRVRLGEVAPGLWPRFYETHDGRLAFSGWTGLRTPGGRLLAGLERIDQEVGDAPLPSW